MEMAFEAMTAFFCPFSCRSLRCLRLDPSHALWSCFSL